MKHGVRRQGRQRSLVFSHIFLKISLKKGRDIGREGMNPFAPKSVSGGRKKVGKRELPRSPSLYPTVGEKGQVWGV